MFGSGGMGAAQGRDGLNATAFPTNSGFGSVEAFEGSAPVVVWRKDLLADSGGAGRWRGGLGQEVEVEVTTDDPVRLALISDRMKHPAGGLAGGGAGAAAASTAAATTAAIGRTSAGPAVWRPTQTTESPGASATGVTLRDEGGTIGRRRAIHAPTSPTATAARSAAATCPTVTGPAPRQDAAPAFASSDRHRRSTIIVAPPCERPTSARALPRSARPAAAMGPSATRPVTMSSAR
jgi:hypothetical protein